MFFFTGALGLLLVVCKQNKTELELPAMNNVQHRK